MVSTTDVPNSNISFLKDVRQVVLTPLLCQLTQLSSFVLPAQRRTEGCRAVLVKLRVPPARTTTLIFCIAFFRYTSIRRMETESPCSTYNMGLFRRVETESPQISQRNDMFRRVETESPQNFQAFRRVSASGDGFSTRKRRSPFTFRPLRSSFLQYYPKERNFVIQVFPILFESHIFLIGVI